MLINWENNIVSAILKKILYVFAQQHQIFYALNEHLDILQEATLVAYVI